MNPYSFAGQKVKLVPLNVEKEIHFWEEWDGDSEYGRLLNDLPVAIFPSTLAKETFAENCGEGALLMIHTLEDDKVIGFVELAGFDWSARNAWVAIGIGEREYRGKGYGTEAMQLLLRYAFEALNLHRINLTVFSYNKRAIRSYEKSGFRYEGTEREVIFKEDQRWDIIDMGILRSDWKLMQQSEVGENQFCVV